MAEKLNTKTLDIPGEERHVYVDKQLSHAARKLYNSCLLFIIENKYCRSSYEKHLLRKVDYAITKVTQVKSKVFK